MQETDIIDVLEPQPSLPGKDEKVVDLGSGKANSVGGWERKPRTGLGGGKSGGGKSDWVGSTKLDRLELELREMRRKRQGAKAVVFSQVWRESG